MSADLTIDEDLEEARRQPPQLARTTWLTALFISLFALLSMIVVTIALFYTINDKNAALRQVEQLQTESACRSGYAQVADIAVLNALHAVLTEDSATRTQDLAEARLAVEGAVELRKGTQDVCSTTITPLPQGPPTLTSIPSGAD